MNKWTRLLAVMLAALISTIGLASLAFAQTDDACYPVPVDDCDEEPVSGVAGDEDVPDQEDEPGGVVGDDQTGSPGTAVVVAGQPATVLAQTGMPAAVLLAVVGMMLAAGIALLRTTRRRAS